MKCMHVYADACLCQTLKNSPHCHWGGCMHVFVHLLLSLCVLNVYEKDGAREGVTS